MSQDDEQANSDAADQNEGEGDDLDTNDDIDTGADDAQDTGDDTAGDDAGDEGGFKTKFEDQQKRANKAEDFLRKAGLDPKTGKPKENKRAPNKDANALSDEDTGRTTKAEDRAERAALRSMG